MPAISFGPLTPILLPCVSNVFMTFAWYGHPKFKQEALWLVILVSLGIAFVEYCFAVPANRHGHGGFHTAAELKTIQEVVSPTAFAGFSVLYPGESFTWMHAAGFACIAFGAFLVFQAG